MFISIVPVVPHTTIVNKTIVYSDTVLSLKDSGNNLKVSSISNVSVYSLESCLKKIFESNSDVVFNTIQYSRNDEMIYFYTDKAISTKAWEESKFIRYKPVSDSKDILEELKNTLIQEKNKDTNCISLYDIAKLLKQKNLEYNRLKKSYEIIFNNSIHSRFKNDSSCVVYNFNYDNNELLLGFKHYKEMKEISFKKSDGDLYISSTESPYAKDILTMLGNDLSNLYDEFIQFSDFIEQFNYNIISNSIFLVNISKYGVRLYAQSKSNIFSNSFELSSYSYSNEYDYDCNSNIVVSAIQGKEDEIFRKIFIRIDDCPAWSKQTLYQVRQEQLAGEKKLEEEQLYKKMKKQKRLKLKRKLFPWTNK